jgi:glycerol-3-phosphate O-acyltransferase/dihydroxyacetone phosphate acyltransferase
MGYYLILQLSRFLLRLFYRRLDVVGLERVPLVEPLVVAANHNNSLVDPLILVATLPRRFRPLAKAGLFHHPLVGPFLWLVGGLPVRRRTDDGGDDPGRNAAMFKAVEDALLAGGAIAIFPEGVTQAEPKLMPVKTGASRMVLGAKRRGAASVTLLPVGLHFQEPGTFRGGSALVLVGEPIRTSDLDETADFDGSVRELTARLGSALKALIVEADDRETLRLLKMVQLVAQEKTSDPAARVSWLRRASEGYRYWFERDPARVADLRKRFTEYGTELERAGFTEEELTHTYSWGGVVRYSLRQGFALLVGLPLAAYGILVHVVPYKLTGLAAGALDRTEEEIATDKIAAGLLVYPVCWLGESLLVSHFLGHVWIFVLLLLPSAFFAIGWHERLERVRRSARGLFAFLGRGDERLRAEREELAREIAELGRGMQGPVPPQKG